MVLQLYTDWLSEPCRAVGILLLENNIEHDVHELDVLKGETHTDSYKKINPVGKIPSIVDDDEFHLGESHTIMRYLCESRKLPDHYYPKDIKQRCRVDFWLDWHHTNLRHAALRLIRANVFGPMRNLPQTTIDESRKEGETALQSSLTFMEETLSKNNYLAGGKQLSIADIALVCEVVMFPVYGASTDGYPHVETWLKRLSTEIKCWNQINAKLDQFLASKKQ
ncbi:unnamed protein product [Adineta ricciae]|uniref:Uncharacterized protein n=1 Tax=Adineta ricciae TaxID=249248 RepID=A0A815UUE2_ADIRI|nr:unnamed protein product [Adineta ricciae]